MSRRHRNAFNSLKSRVLQEIICLRFLQEINLYISYTEELYVSHGAMLLTEYRWVPQKRFSWFSMSVLGLMGLQKSALFLFQECTLVCNVVVV